ncbi:MAG TPA: serine/threonine protein kinase [Oceanithermus profundus]|uniref:Serine/threonine protein kinase n=1 Tax=Oceanithermus profundus TaxID=187137 RepID=A0A7C4V685_9DEIN|nr:serine/threonine protein kinase [Oceanithermus profundus]
MNRVSVEAARYSWGVVMPGRVLLDRYRVVRPIARGAVATVYLAFDPEGRPFAVKVFPEGYAARADREWQVGRALEHPNINPVLERLDVDAYPAVLLAYAPGERLANLPASGRPFLPIFRQLITALAHMHGRGLVHRDVKPENVIVNEAGHARLIDFDLSGPRHEATGSLRLGTIAYIAPEQVRGEPTTPASDVYAAGVILYWGLTGELPYVGSPQAVMESHLSEPLPPATGYEPESPLGGVIGRMVAKDPGERYPDAAAVLAALEGLT